MGAPEIIKALDDIKFDRKQFIKETFMYLVDTAYQEADIDGAMNRLLYKLEEGNDLPEWIDDLIVIVGPDNANKLLRKAIAVEVGKWLDENNLQDEIDKALGV